MGTVNMTGNCMCASLDKCPKKVMTGASLYLPDDAPARVSVFKESLS